jgi:hypothetical protein
MHNVSVLERYAAQSYGPWYVRHAAGIIAIVVGFVGLVAAYWLQFGPDHAITQVPDLRVTIPFLVVTVASGTVALVRGERMRGLPIAGMAMATAATVLGWFILVAAVAAVAVIAILIAAKLN